VVTRQGFGKRLRADAIRAQARGGKGLKLIGIRDNDAVTSLHAVGQPDSLEDGLEEEVIMGSEKGLLNRIRLADVTQQSRLAT
jgi:DNA gyrase/topoisomerase IV subunit A